MESDHAAVLSALSDKGVFDAEVLVTYASFYLGGITTPVHLRIWYNGKQGAGPYRYETSHHIKTPLQAGPYLPSHCAGPDVNSTIRAALEGMNTFYRSAIAKGLEPSTDWLSRSRSWDPEA